MAGRRGNGEGTIYQLADGRWRGQATIAGKRAGVYGATRKEAQTKLRQLIGEADRGILPVVERATVGEYMTRWLVDEVRHTRKARTYDSYSDAARLYIVPTIGAIKLTQLQPAHVKSLHAAMLGDGLAPRTIRIAHGALHCALKQAVEWGMLPRNVAAYARPPRLKRAEVQAFDSDEARRLREVAGPTRWGPLLAVALATGLRQGELLGLTWADIDLTDGVIAVRRQLGHDGQFGELKHDGQRRGIDVPASTIATLREHKARQNEARLLLGPDWHDHNLVFATHAGKPLGHRNVIREYKAILRRAGLPLHKFHALRHTNATLLLSQGIHPKIVQERLGHASITITLDIYSHVLPRMGKDAAAKLDALLG